MASITSFLLLVSLVLVSCSLTICFASEYEVEKESEFAYVEGAGKGPRSWGKIDPHWEACGKGHMQSPIDLLDIEGAGFSWLRKVAQGLPSSSGSREEQARGHDIAVNYSLLSLH